MNMLLEGKVFAFGKNIDTDQIYPSRFVELTEEDDIKKYAMYGIDPDFTKKFTAGDIIVSDTNFGCGSSREHAAITLKTIGVAAIVAESFGRIFFRNAVNLGIPVIQCKNISKFAKTGDILQVNLSTGKITNKTTGDFIDAIPMSDYILKIIESGGIKPLIHSMNKSNID